MLWGLNFHVEFRSKYRMFLVVGIGLSIFRKHYLPVVGERNRRAILPVMMIGLLLSSAHFSHSQDTDGDGLSDAEETTLGTNPNLADSDGDGLGDKQEVTLGSNPTNALGMPKTKLVYWGPSSGVAAAAFPTNLPSDLVKISAGEFASDSSGSYES